MTNTNPPAAAPDLDALMRRAMEMGPCSRVEVFREDIFYLIRAARDRAALLRAAEKLRSAQHELIHSSNLLSAELAAARKQAVTMLRGIVDDVCAVTTPFIHSDNRAVHDQCYDERERVLRIVRNYLRVRESELESHPRTAPQQGEDKLDAGKVRETVRKAGNDVLSQFVRVFQGGTIPSPSLQLLVQDELCRREIERDGGA